MNVFTLHPMLPQARRLALAATAALALTCAATTAFAQPDGGMRGMHGGGPIDLLVPHMLEKAKASLNLNTSQQAMWDNIVAQGKAAHDEGRTNRQKVKAVLQAELAKPEPDLAAIAAAADTVEQQNRALRQQVRTQWLNLYATFTPEQKGVVRDLLQKRLARAESFHEKMMEHVRGALPHSS
jgi:Spy/CpxP family protein refolding chaperone